MSKPSVVSWKDLVVSPEEVMGAIKPGMNIFLGSGVAEPRTLMRCLIDSDLSNVNDLEFIQLNSHGDILSVKELHYQNYRLKTFFSGWGASEVSVAGPVDLIPIRYSQTPLFFQFKPMPIDATFVQITPPDEAGYCSLGLAVDVAREAMEQASLVVGEINTRVPFTFGDTIVSLSDFDMLVRSTEPPDYFDRLPVSDASDQVAANIASVIEDGDCLCFRMPTSLSRGLCRRLTGRRHLGVHSPYFTDELMDLVKSGAVSNYRKGVFRGKSIASYILGTSELMTWLDRNPLVELQSIGQVCDPTLIGRNPNFVGVFHARKVDLFSRVSSFVGRGSFTSGPSIAADMITGAEISAGGRTVFGLPSRDEKGESNIQVELEDYRSQYHMRESINMVVTEYGIANLKWRSIRERAQALIDIAHPDDREDLVQKAKEKKILFPDQIFLSKSARLYPMDIASEHTFKGGVKVRFRAIKPSDEEAMRRFFYRFSDMTIYRRYFYPIKTMPHYKMQEYVNVDYSSAMSIVALVGESDHGKIIAEARFVKDEESAYGDVAFVVDEESQGLGIASYLYEMLIRLAKERGLKGFTAEVLHANKGMMKVFEKGDFQIITQLKNDVYRLTIPFDAQLSQTIEESI